MHPNSHHEIDGACVSVRRSTIRMPSVQARCIWKTTSTSALQQLFYSEICLCLRGESLCVLNL